MMDTQDITSKAKSILRKHIIKLMIGEILGLLAFFAVIYWSDSMVQKLISMLIFLLYLRLFASFLTFKDLFSHLNMKMDAPLYYALVKHGKFCHASAVYQIQAEYFIGNYTNVIALCNRKLGEKRLAKHFQYHYFYYLANTYFNLGEDEKLREICDLFYQKLATERKKDKIFKRFADFSFFSIYLNRNFEACEQHLNKVQKIPLVLADVAFSKARVALLKGETEEAKNYFKKVIAEAPLLHYADLSKAALQAMENGMEYQEAMVPFAEKESPKPLTPPAVASGLPIFQKIMTVILIVLIAVYVILMILTRIGDENYEDWNEYYRDVEALVEADYGEAELLDAFDLEKDGFWVDSMFLCKTSDSILVGSIYYYTDDADTLYYEVQAQILISALMAEDFRQLTNTYGAVTEECSVTSGFYADEKDVPSENYYSVSFIVEGKTFWFAVTEIVDGIYTV